MYLINMYGLYCCINCQLVLCLPSNIFPKLEAPLILSEFLKQYYSTKAVIRKCHACLEIITSKRGNAPIPVLRYCIFKELQTISVQKITGNKNTECLHSSITVFIYVCTKRNNIQMSWLSNPLQLDKASIVYLDAYLFITP